MTPVLFPVVFIGIKIKSSFFLYTKDIIQLEEFPLPLMSCWLAHSNESAAIIDKFPHSCKNLRICPVLTTGLCSVRITYIDDHIKIIQQIFILTDIIKADKGHIKRRTA